MQKKDLKIRIRNNWESYVTFCTNDYAYAAMKKWEEMKSTLWLIVSRGY